MGALTGLKAKVSSELEGFGLKNIYVKSQRPDSGPQKHASEEQIKFTPSQFEGLLEHCPSVETFTRNAEYQSAVQHGNRSVEDATITCVDASWLQIMDRELLLGRPFSHIEKSHGRRVCLIDIKLRDKLHMDKDCRGKFISIGNINHRIIGVVEEKPPEAFAGSGGGERYQVVIPFMAQYQDSRPWFWVIASSRTPETTEEAKAELTFYLRRMRNQNPGDPDTFHIQTIGREMEKFNTIMGTITAVAGGIVGISLLVGGIGIMNIMLVSVSERTREIGLRKAVGARGSAILTQFLIEAVVLCCVGGAIGVGFGYLVTQGIRQIPNAQLEQAEIPGWAILMSIAFSVGVGIFFGVFPAMKAARLDPIEALRNE
jgi:putative ABC transport system permease protein